MENVVSKNNQSKWPARREFDRSSLWSGWMLTSRYFQPWDYFNFIFAPHIVRQLEPVKRLDIVWDVYKDDSLKKPAREKQESGQRRKLGVLLFDLGYDISAIVPCTHKKADTLIMV